MTVMISLIKRNLKLFFRDKTSVFFSLLAVFIIIGLYVLFLGNMMTKNLEDLLGKKTVPVLLLTAGLWQGFYRLHQ